MSTAETVTTGTIQIIPRSDRREFPTIFAKDCVEDKSRDSSAGVKIGVARISDYVLAA